MKQFDIITVGNATIDAFLSMQGTDHRVRVDTERHELCFPYGGKIAVDHTQFLLGGNACNVAVGLSRMGLSAVLCAEIGDDEFAAKITNGLKKEQVDKALLIKTKGAATSFSVGINVQGERTLFVQHVKRRHDFQFHDLSARWVYLSSVGNEWEAAYARTLTFVNQTNVKLACNPGTLQLHGDPQKLQEVLFRTEILFVNKEEGQRLLACGEGCKCAKKNDDSKDLLRSLHGIGPRIVVLTDGKNGSYVSEANGGMYHVGIANSPIVERTGAGDGYTTGFLAAVMQGTNLQTAMQWGTINAASVVGKVGSQPGLLTKQQMQEELQKHTEVKVTEL